MTTGTESGGVGALLWKGFYTVLATDSPAHSINTPEPAQSSPVTDGDQGGIIIASMKQPLLVQERLCRISVPAAYFLEMVFLPGFFTCFFTLGHPLSLVSVGHVSHHASYWNDSIFLSP